MTAMAEPDRTLDMRNMRAGSRGHTKLRYGPALVVRWVAD